MDVYTIVLLALLAVMIFFMFRNSKKRKAEMEAVREKMVPGVEVMTNFGLFGTLIAVDDETNIAEVETSPGTIVRVHRQTLSRVVEDTPAETVVDADELPAEPVLGDETPTADPTRRPGKSDGTE
ncbi:preprotein translocase subunit YajC [Lysobacter korlensis]|uniref:Sec translocon accessory complex subunit YajC n=1 Tax=Lysobacter korlensis TaxID=553636 RepID=A0ABV6RM53_9GAMM